MNGLLERLSGTRALLLSFAAMVVLGAALRFAGSYTGTPLLDFIWSGDAAAAHLSAMTAGQRAAHAWATGGLDTLYPLAYGGFFAGLAARFAGPRAALAALPMLAGIGFDYAENAVQVLALTGQEGLIGAKSVLTPVKFALVYAGIGVALALAGLALVRRVIRRKD